MMAGKLCSSRFSELGITKLIRRLCLPKNNTDEFVPTDDYHPATKAYADSVCAALTAADVGLGNVPNLDTTDAVNNEHTHANSAELDLVTDGDHDVRTDDPHSTLPSQSGHSGEFLTTNGSAASWGTPAGGGNPECYFSIWAEENSTLGASNTYEWAFGNGANTASDEGVMMYVPSGWTCTCVAMGAQIGTASSSATIELVLNGTPQGSSANIVLSSAANGLSELGTPLSISSGDRVNFRTTSSSSTQASCTVIAWFRMVKS